MPETLNNTAALEEDEADDEKAESDGYSNQDFEQDEEENAAGGDQSLDHGNSTVKMDKPADDAGKTEEPNVDD